MNKEPGFFKKHLTLIIAILLLCDVGFSFYQYYHQAFDGDTTLIVLPGKIYEKVLSDPLGLSVIQEGESYAATNRYFAHATMVVYYRSMPFLLQTVTSPLNSIYLSSAIVKTFIHFFLVFIIGVYISGKFSLRNRSLLIAMILVTPLFHNYGSEMYLGFIDYAVNYAIFYALPLGLIMLFFLPFWLKGFHGKKGLFKPGILIGLALLAVLITFNGPLAPVVLAILSAVVFTLHWWKKHKEESDKGLRNILSAWWKQGPEIRVLLPFTLLLCIYSYYLGTYNSEHNWWPMNLADRYALLPQGLLELVTKNTGVPLLLLGIIINVIVLSWNKTDKPARSHYLFLLLVIFIVGFAYLCLLPMGGYREYRPYIIRRDTAMPFLLGLVLWYGLSTHYLLYSFRRRKFTIYLLGVITFLLIFISNDPAHFGHYKCEREALEELVLSEERVVELPAKCPILGWGIMTDTISTDYNVRMLRYWNVIDGDKKYYQSAISP